MHPIYHVFILFNPLEGKKSQHFKEIALNGSKFHTSNMYFLLFYYFIGSVKESIQ